MHADLCRDILCALLEWSFYLVFSFSCVHFASEVNDGLHRFFEAL